MDGATSLDALLIVNELATARVHDRATGRLNLITDDVAPPPFYDVNGDGNVTALDALQVLNRIQNPALDPESVDQVILQIEETTLF